MLPSLTPINSSDIETLDAFRLERFRAFFAPRNPQVNIYLCELGRTLIVSGGSEIQELLKNRVGLVQGAWYILASVNILIYQYDSLIYQAQNISDKLGKNAAVEFEAMVAIQEKMSADTVVENGVAQEDRKTNAAQIIRSVSVADLAADLEATDSAIQSFLEERGATLIDFGGTIIVPESEAVIAYEHYSLIRARQKMQERFAAPVAGGEKPQAPAIKNVTPKESKPKKPTLTFKGKFQVNRSNYKRTIENFLNAMFPDKTEEQVAALDDISQQSEMGKAYLDKIVKTGEYKDKEHARVNLLKAAAQLQGTSDDAQSSEEKIEATA